jgi:GT2 family glycosyltransferase
MTLYDAQREGLLISGGGPAFLPASPNTLPDMRNAACRMLLDDTEAEWLLFIDSDMGFDEGTLYALLASADPDRAPVLGALCFGMRQVEADGMGGFRTHPFPVLFDWLPDDTGKHGFKIRYDYTPDVVTRVAATGAAFLLIHRSALEAVRADHGDTWFDRAVLSAGEGLMGEDVAFCARLGRLGIPVHVHTGVTTTHLKPVWVSADYYADQHGLAMYRRALEGGQS